MRLSVPLCHYGMPNDLETGKCYFLDPISFQTLPGIANDVKVPQSHE